MGRKIVVPCAVCGKPKVTTTSEAKKYPRQYCSFECRSKARSAAAAEQRINVPCAHCGKPLSMSPAAAARFAKHFCNNECKLAYVGQQRIVVRCANCGKEKYVCQAQLDKRELFFCGLKCMGIYWRGKYRPDRTQPARVVQVPCDTCGKLVTRQTSKVSPHTFCSRACRGKWQSEHPRDINKITVQCGHCHKQIGVWPSRYTPGRAYYCSRRCKSAAQVVPATHVTRACAKCGREYMTTIHQVTKRDGKYCGVQCRNDALRTRDGAHSFYWRSIAKKIRQRDNYTCQLCGLHRIRPALHVHHIVPAASFGVDRVMEANDPSNLITLCPTCHRRIEANPSLLTDIQGGTGS